MLVVRGSRAKRTTQLDRVATSRKIIHLDCSQDKAASKALYIAIIAFAAQWAQGSGRAKDQFPSFFDEEYQPPPGESHRPQVEEFDQVMQCHLWEQARHALENIDGVPQRIQNWFICISAHWNLAVLILADLIDVVDSRQLGTNCAEELSDLA
ncbi:hypothetical protein FE257_000005 [Aspergillus nanangensis]|uniref:Uncharacterized protein n=1 Tax=Aspergillus nanangensis TaxID=2582783 RepID=A0AAD4CZ18_ASPNN|nr:hypothetical protein FE257_000005 [Aspergillus nanangensis]